MVEPLPLPDNLVGAAFQERYDIESRLGQGGFGVVYKATQRATGQKVAIKLLRPFPAESESFVSKQLARFRREMRLCAQLYHPNIVRLIDSGLTPEGSLFTAFELVPGLTLAEVLAKEGAMDPQEAAHLMLQVLDALSCAHKLGVVHRDLKPHNIMVTQTGVRRNALVLDFGLGTLIEGFRTQDDIQITSAREVLGTPAYAAPEQLRGAEPTPRSDLYAWGLVFIECLTGKPVMYGRTLQEVLYKQLGPEPVPVPAWLENQPLGRILQRTTIKDVDEREATAQDLVATLVAQAPDILGPRRPGPSPVMPPGGLRDRLAEEERRPLTAASFHIALEQRDSRPVAFDALNEILEQVHALCLDIARRFDAHVAGTVGERVLLYFGYPTAREDDAHRAGRAALALVTALADSSTRLEAEHGLGLEVRGGIHTGLVIRDARARGGHPLLPSAWGSTPLLASRLASQAGPSEIYASAETRQLLRNHFTFEPVGAGSSSPGPNQVFRIGRALEHNTPNDVPAPRPEHPMVGRAQELELLRQRWTQARQGVGQSVLVTGEPGIGKSRLISELVGQIRGTSHLYLECRCAPEDRNSELRPVVEMLERLLGRTREWSAEKTASELEALLTRNGFELPLAMPLFAPLLSISPGPAYPPLLVSPERQKTLTLEAVLSLVFELSVQHPVLMLVEDLHWVDPSTLELLTLLVKEAPAARLCAVFTARPEFVPPWTTSQVLLIQLGRLERPQVEELISVLSEGRTLPGELVDKMAYRADGVPLFIEELTRSVLESEILQKSGERSTRVGMLATLEIPTTLRGSLMARLDRLGPARQTAQLAAALGREFSLDVLRAVSPHTEPELQEQLDTLVAADLVHHRRRLRNPTYVFKHALIRDAAYDILPKPAQRQVHALIASVLEDRFKDMVETRPELLAYHHSAAEQKLAALPYAKRAATKAIQRSANAEAIGHAREALEWLPAIQDARDRAEAELDFNGITLQALSSSQGWASLAVSDLAEKSRVLLPTSRSFGHTVTILFPLYIHCHVASDRARSRQVAEELVQFAHRTEDQGLQSVAATTKGVNFHAEGRFLEAEWWLEKARTLYDPARDREQGSIFGMDCRAWATAQLAWVQFGMGRTRRAFELAHEAIAWARTIGHVPSLGLGLLYISQIYQISGDRAAVRLHAGELLEAAKTYGLPAYEGYAAAIASWAEGDLKGVQQIIRILESLNCNLILTYYGSYLADIEFDAGHVEQAIQYVETYLALCDRLGEHVFEAELLRRRALFEMKMPAPDLERARASLTRAHTLAREQGIHRFEVAAIRDYQRLFDDGEPLIERLAQIYEAFPDLRPTQKDEAP